MIAKANLFSYFLFFYSSLVTIRSQGVNYYNETINIGCGGPLYQNVRHIKRFYRASIYSPIDLPACEPNQANDTIYWMVPTDLCRSNRTNAYFISIGADGNGSRCANSHNQAVSNASCHNDYNVTRKSMTIRNLTEASIKEYICFVGQKWTSMISTSAISFNITIERSATTTADYSSSSSSNGTEMTTGKTSLTTTEEPTSDDSQLRTILLAVLIPLSVIAVIFIGILVFCCIRQRTKKEQGFSSSKTKSMSKLPVISDHKGDVYDMTLV